MTQRSIIISFLAVLLFFGLTQAQFDDSVPPPLNPYDNPWPTPSGPNDPNSGAPGSTPPPPASPFSDPFDRGDSDEFEPSYSPDSGGGSSAREGKSSFVLEEASSVQGCTRYTNALLDGKIFADFSDCQFSLEQKVEDDRNTIEATIDRFERQKLKKVIRGELDRSQSKQYRMSFDRLNSRLNAELKTGCQCVK